MVKKEVHQSAKTEPRLFYGYIVAAVAFLIILLAYGGRFSFGVFFKPMASEFGWSRGLTSGAFTLSLVMQGLWGIIMGRLNDRFGPRFIITICCFFLGLGFLLMSLTGYSWQLYLFYGVITGIGMGGVYVALLSTVTRWFVKRRGAMTGIVLAGLSIGMFISPPVANWLISIYDWRMSYIIVGGVILILGIAAAQFLRREPKEMRLVPYGKNEGKEPELTSSPGGISLKEAVYTGQFWIAAVIFFCVGYDIWAISIHLVPHVTDLGISAVMAANILAVSGGLQAAGGLLLGGAADKIGGRWATVISFILMAASVFYLAPITEVWMFYLFVVVFGLGVGGGGAMLSIVVAELFGVRSHGFILGVIACCFTIGGAVVAFLTGYLFDVNGSYLLAFMVCGAVGVVGLILALTLKPVKKSGGKTQLSR